MKVYIFLGPSLSVVKAQRLLQVTYLPPVQQGDVLQLIKMQPAVIGIIDGFFETVPSVWHKEILAALSQGVHVFGAASMGALRAAELEPFGMVGVGRVFEWYRDGVITADDEVAVAHGREETNYSRISDALVDIREACEDAALQNILPFDLAEQFVQIGKRMFFADRSYNAIAHQAAQMGVSRDVIVRFLEFIKHRGPGVKERDAMALLLRINGVCTTPLQPFQATFTLEPTEFLERLHNEVQFAQVTQLGGPPADDFEILRGVATLSTLRKKSLLRILARQEAERLGWRLTEEEVQEKANILCMQAGLEEPERVLAWMEREGLSEASFWQFINDACLIDKLERLHGHAIERNLADQLRLATAHECFAPAERKQPQAADRWP
jgi:hypothetical protein